LRHISIPRLANLVAALLASAAVLYVSFFGAGPLPPLGPAFNPATGAWTMAADAASLGSQTLKLAGLDLPVRVIFETDGTAHVIAQTDHDLFLSVGYLHARFRLFQMDLLRRQGEGRLSEVVGKAALDVDRFELQLGLLRTAQAEWAQLTLDDPSRAALNAYAQGVNDRIDEAVRLHQLPAMFALLDYRPQHWTPIDSLLVKGDMTQTLDFNDTPLVMALLDGTLGSDLTNKWFPILPPNAQSPYEPGPYPVKATPAPLPLMNAMSTAEANSVAALYQRLAALPVGLVATGGDSNNWAVAGAKSTSGGALLAGDPHLHLTLPAIWYQLSMDSPNYHASGVSIPGTPGVLIGHNQHIAWSLTNGQNQATFFYFEQQDSAHPNQYVSHGAWVKYQTVNYDIPVRGGATDHLIVKLSSHGPVISDRGLTMSVWWAGNLPSLDLSVLLRIGQAANFKAFRDALPDWHAPSQNFVYADDQGNIGLVSAGYYPLINGGEPWLPLDGSGAFDVSGTIPYDAVPQVYDPPGNIVWTANQRQVGPDYPYYIGTASNFFDPGYRANEIYRVLSQDQNFSAADMMALQNDTRDFLASEITPVLVKTLASATLTLGEHQALDLISTWDFHMDIGSAGATIWWTFWQQYLSATFDPVWKAHNVTVARSELNKALGQDLEAWTLTDPGNSAFSAGGVKRTASDVMVTAFRATVKALIAQLGPDASTWAWGRIHTRVLENLARIAGLNYGPRPDRGDAYTPLAAGNFPSTSGPSWRMVVDWGSNSFSGIYPGGQSENPATGWYSNRVDTWWDGLYAQMLSADQASASSGTVTWTLKT
jgi:penicillin G amidase